MNDHSFELYKLHVELADRVSQRREGANRLYVTLLGALAVFLASWLRFGTALEGSGDLLLSMIGVLGVALSASWFLTIRSYRQLNSGKYQALLELEGALGLQFLSREWALLGQGRGDQYLKLTTAETVLPIVFGTLFAGIAICSLAGVAAC